MALLNSRYHCHGSPYIITEQPRPTTSLDQWAGSFQASNPQRGWNGWGIDKNAKCATSSGDWHKASWLPAPQRFTSFHCCSSLLLFPLISALLCPSLHSQIPPCLWRHCMKWILPHPAGEILISFLPPPPFPLLSSYPTALIAPLPLSPPARSDYPHLSHTHTISDTLESLVHFKVYKAQRLLNPPRKVKETSVTWHLP